MPELPEVRDVAGNTFNWVMGVHPGLWLLVRHRKARLRQWLWGIVLLVIAAVAGYLIFWDLSRRGWGTFSGKDIPVGASSAVEGD